MSLSPSLNNYQFMALFYWPYPPIYIPRLFIILISPQLLI